MRLIHDGPDDIEIPGAGYSFRTLKNAQAAGDLKTLLLHGRPAERVRLEGDDPAAALRAPEQPRRLEHAHGAAGDRSRPGRLRRR